MDIEGSENRIVVLLAAAVMSFVVMGLWNWLMPATVCVAPDQFLAGARSLASGENPVRRIPRTARRAHALERTHDGTLGEDDP